MNVVFLAVFLVSVALVVLRDPAAFLPALLTGAGKAVTTCLTLASAYAVWMGFLKIAEAAGVLRGMSRAMRPLSRRLFRTDDDKALEQIAVNLSANFLGMGGAATPAGISAMNLLGARKKNEYSRAMFFAVNCSGVQLLPTTALALRVQAGAQNAYSILLPAYLSELAALLVGMALVMIVYGRKRG